MVYTMRQIIDRYHIRSGCNVRGINRTDIPYISAVLISSARKNTYPDTEFEYIGCGLRGDQVMKGGNAFLNAVDRPVIVLRWTAPNTYESLGMYHKLDGHSVKEHDGRQVIVFHLSKMAV